MKKRSILSLLLVVTLVLGTMISGACFTFADTSGGGNGSDFKDVTDDSWYAESVEFVYDNGLMNGLSADCFAPKANLTRAMFVTILGRMAGVNQSRYTKSSFYDVETGQWYSAYIEWAYEHGITNGMGEKWFGVNENVTREQIAVFITRYVSYADIALPAAADPLSKFSDNDKVSTWAADAVDLMRKSGILAGDDLKRCNPQNPAERAQAAAIFERLYKAAGGIVVNYAPSDWSDFAQVLSGLVDKYNTGSSVSGAEESGRLIISSDSVLPPLTDFGSVYVLKDLYGNYIVQFENNKDAEKCAEYLETIPGVNYTEIDSQVTAYKSYEPVSWGSTETNCGFFASKLVNSGVDNAVTVAVIDSGIDIEHEMLKDRTVGGFDFINGLGDVEDENGHGTHVSGIIADSTPGLNVKIMPVRVLDDRGIGAVSAAANAIRYSADSGADVINLSIGADCLSEYMDEAVIYARNKGVTVVAAAGNSAEDTAGKSPAHLSESITVASVNSALNHSGFSNFGDSIDIAAPGQNILSSLPNNRYGSQSGTSAAAPYVSAAAAMTLLKYPSYTPDDIEKALKNAATDLGDAGWDKYYGAGFLNMKKV